MTQRQTAKGLAAGTEIATADGMRPVETLAAGDRVITLDRGLQPLRAVARAGALTLVQLPEGALGNSATLSVAPGQLLLRSGWQVELLFGTDQVLAEADLLAGTEGIRDRTGDAWTLAFDGAEMVLAGDLWTAVGGDVAPRPVLTRDEVAVLATYGRQPVVNASPALRLVA